MTVFLSGLLAGIALTLVVGFLWLLQDARRA